MSGGLRKGKRKKAGPVFFTGLKGGAVLAGWIGGLALAGLLLWAATASLRGRFLMRTVNRILEDGKSPYRLSSVMSGGGAGSRAKSRAKSLMGSWYTLADREAVFFVFTLFREGITIPCGALVNPAGRVEELIPLSVHGAEMMNRIPRGVIAVYIRRIEAAFGGKAR
ncbi:MAG: hypothetical protein LBS06_06260 [Treponema sp.]|jgi:hypothetical protein|nr:hypothetical protein [Treponema sp.]